MSDRDVNPLASQVNILFGKNGGRCAYPGCGATLTMDSRSRGDRPRNVGKVAHITAASPDGPRYDASLTSAERRAETNLILLCGTHHDQIDYQLEFHTTEWLKAAKAQNESRVQRGYLYAMGNVGFKQLEMVCAAIQLAGAGQTATIEDLVLPLDIDDKMALNSLTSAVRVQIELGLAQEKEVRTYITTMDAMIPNFASGLSAHFKAVYYRGLADGIVSDDLFSSILGAAIANCGPDLSPEVQAAALAVVVHLFVICEIFEHESTAA